MINLVWDIIEFELPVLNSNEYIHLSVETIDVELKGRNLDQRSQYTSVFNNELLLTLQED